MPNYINSEVRGYHAYRVKPLPSELLICRREPHSRFDRHAVRVENDKGQTTGHLAARLLPVNKVISYMLSHRDVEILW